jgi:hypothetical protein
MNNGLAKNTLRTRQAMTDSARGVLVVRHRDPLIFGDAGIARSGLPMFGTGSAPRR